MTQWISVDEQLPDDKWSGASDRVLICIKRSNAPVTQEVALGHYDYYRNHWCQWMGPVDNGEVTHWQIPPELPEPPKD